MKLAMIGFGQAGGKIVDTFLDYERRTGAGIVQAAVAVNTAKADLQGLDTVQERDRILIGQSRVKGHGVGADNELGASIAEEEIGEVQHALDDLAVHEVDAFLVVAGLGGGTGSGGAPVLAKHLKRLYTEPVYGLGVLPGSDEGGIYTLNAARSLKTFVDEVDNLLLFDNDAWRQTGESVQQGYDQLNEELVRQFGTLFRAGEVQPGETVAESIVDASEVINTLRSGGISTLGFARAEVDVSRSSGLVSRFGSSEKASIDPTAAVNRVSSLVRRATLGRLTLPCSVDTTERALVVVSGPSQHLNRKGIEHGRKWLEEETTCMEVRGGDHPYRETGAVSATVLLSGVTNVPRVKRLQQVAIEAQDALQEIRAESEEKLDDLVRDADSDLDSLF